MALDGLEPLEVQEALCVLVAGRVAIKHCLHVCQSGIHDAWVCHIAVLDDLDQLRAVQCGAGQLVGQDEVEALFDGRMAQYAAVQEAGEGGLCVCVCLGLLPHAVPQLLLAEVVRHGAPALRRVVVCRT